MLESTPGSRLMCSDPISRSTLTQDMLALCGVQNLHYMSHRENMLSILRRGILSYSRAAQIPHCDCSDPSVQLHREFVVQVSNRKLHEYACLYFATHTPMQYVLTQGTARRPAVMYEEDLVFVDVDPV